ALKYSLGEVVVKARHRPDEGVVVTSVIDTGAGIPRDAHDRIFEKFFRVTAAGRRAGMGAGLGLAICKAITEAHGGKIGVESSSSRGSTFWFSLPVPGAATRGGEAVGRLGGALEGAGEESDGP
ncbi:MAG: HAMP domain-containing sensor histidine kinase, partial [Dehalococcoidia bacterium]